MTDPELLELVLNLTQRKLLILYYLLGETSDDSNARNINESISEITEAVIDMPCGTLYPSLEQLNKIKFVESKMVDRNSSERQAYRGKIYSITWNGRRALTLFDDIIKRLRRGCDA